MVSLTAERKVVVVFSTLTVMSPVSLVVLQLSVAEVSPTLEAMVEVTVEVEVEVAAEGSPEIVTSRAPSTAVSSSSSKALKPSRYDMRLPIRSSTVSSWTRGGVRIS